MRAVFLIVWPGQFGIPNKTSGILLNRGNFISEKLSKFRVSTSNLVPARRMSSLSKVGSKSPVKSTSFPLLVSNLSRSGHLLSESKCSIRQLHNQPRRSYPGTINQKPPVEKAFHHLLCRGFNRGSRRSYHLLLPKPPNPRSPYNITHCSGQIPNRNFLAFTRLYAQQTFTKQEIEEAKRWLDAPSINKSLFEITFSRSSGPGGQKVNKTSSKATISLEPWKWLNPQFCFWIPKPILAQLSEKRIRYHTKLGGLLIQSDRSRNREENTADCFKKLGDEIKRVVEFEGEVSEEDKAKWDELAKVRKERLVEQKKRQKEKRQGRSKRFDLG